MKTDLELFPVGTRIEYNYPAGKLAKHGTVAGHNNDDFYPQILIDWDAGPGYTTYRTGMSRNHMVETCTIINGI